MHIHGALGVSNEMPLARMWWPCRMMGLADGPTEVHKMTVARQVLTRLQADDDLWPTEHRPKKMAAAGEVRGSTSSRGGQLVSATAKTDRFASFDGTGIAYITEGPNDGPAVLLLHGFAANHDLNWVRPGVVGTLRDRRPPGDTRSTPTAADVGQAPRPGGLHGRHDAH